MKKIIIILFVMAALPSIVFGGTAAPYTEDAKQKIVKAMIDTPKKEHKEKLSKEQSHKNLVEYFSNIYEKAGFSFNDTIDKIVDDMKNDPGAIPKDRETVYNEIYMFLLVFMYQCKSDKVDCLQFFPSDTQESIQWFMENNDFSKQMSNGPHGAK